MPATVTCKNCSKQYQGHFCPQCGQSAHTERIGLAYFMHDIPHSVFHIDKGFFYTLKWMFKSPGTSIKEYLEGKRAKHYRPFAYVILMSTICTLLVPFIEKLTYYQVHHIFPKHIELVFFQRYFSLLIFLLIPFLSLVTWLFFKNKGYNYWEHFLGNTFMAAQLNVVILALKLVNLVKVSMGFEEGTKFTIFMIIFMFYYSYAFKNWMKPYKGKMGLFWRLFFMNICLVFIYLNAFVLVGIMYPWWKG